MNTRSGERINYDGGYLYIPFEAGDIPALVNNGATFEDYRADIIDYCQDMDYSETETEKILDVCQIRFTSR